MREPNYKALVGFVVVGFVVVGIACLIIGAFIGSDFLSVVGLFLGALAGIFTGGDRPGNPKLPTGGPGVRPDSGRGGPDSSRLDEVRASLDRGAERIRESERSIEATQDRLREARDGVASGIERANRLSDILRRRDKDPGPSNPGPGPVNGDSVGGFGNQ